MKVVSPKLKLMFRNLSAVGFGEGFTLVHKLALAGKTCPSLASPACSAGSTKNIFGMD